MWARLQGVGISVRADTALPWPLPLLHKTSQPALSPGLESVSAATCQIKAKRTKTLSFLFSSSGHQHILLRSRSFCLITDELHLWGKPVSLHTLSNSQTQPASVRSPVCCSVCPLFFSRVTHHQSNLVFMF